MSDVVVKTILEPPLTEVKRVSAEKLQEIFRDVQENKIFTSAHLLDKELPTLLPLVFLPIALGALDGVPEEVKDQMGILWQYLDKAGPRTVNGLPVFTEFNVLHKEDWFILSKMVREAVLSEANTTLDTEDVPADVAPIFEVDDEFEC